jgi:hypothetical protein
MHVQEQVAGTIEMRRTDALVWTPTPSNSDSPAATDSDLNPRPRRDLETPLLFQYANRTTFAERYPLLTCIAISFGLLASALIMEIECLKGSGYFWRRCEYLLAHGIHDPCDQSRCRMNLRPTESTSLPKDRIVEASTGHVPCALRPPNVLQADLASHGPRGQSA